MTTSTKKRLVAIVGRPNVGKSALFNRLAGGRYAIVHEESGVTRDRMLRQVERGGTRFQLIDTGGVSSVDGEQGAGVIESGIHKQVEAALVGASVALLVVDVEVGLTPLDEAVLGWLRPTGCQTLVVANKSDNPERDVSATDFDRLGLPVFPVSALHNRGIDALVEAVAALLPPEEAVEEVEALRVAVVGRPNVGKSSFVNRLLGDARVIVSDVPGTTRDSIDVPYTVGVGKSARHYLLIDTAGVRRRGKIDNMVERFSRMRTEGTIQRAQVCVLILDAAAGPTEQDKKIAAMIVEHRRAAVLVVNKWDLAVKVGSQERYVKAVRDALPFMSYCPIVCVSAATGQNMRASIAAINAVAEQVQVKLSTGLLNRALSEAAERVSAPAIQGKILKMYYATQTGTDPVRIRIFANKGTGVPPAYREYLIHALRLKFGLAGVPILIQFTERSRESRVPSGDA